MPKVSIDTGTCVGCGLCVNACPDVFELNNDGIAVVKSSQASASCDLADIVSQCPVSAISID